MVRYYFLPLLNALTFDQNMLFFQTFWWIFIFSISTVFNFNHVPHSHLHSELIYHWIHDKIPYECKLSSPTGSSMRWNSAGDHLCNLEAHSGGSSSTNHGMTMVYHTKYSWERHKPGIIQKQFSVANKTNQRGHNCCIAGAKQQIIPCHFHWRLGQS